MDIAGVILLALDLNGCITMLNRKGYDLLEYPEEALTGRNWLDTCLPKRERSRLLAAFGQLAAGNIQFVEHLENGATWRGKRTLDSLAQQHDLRRSRNAGWHLEFRRGHHGAEAG